MLFASMGDQPTTTGWSGINRLRGREIMTRTIPFHREEVTGFQPAILHTPRPSPDLEACKRVLGQTPDRTEFASSS